MKKLLVGILLTLSFTVLGQKQMVSMLSETVMGWLQQEAQTMHSDVQHGSFSEQLGAREAHDLLDVTLYYRYADTGLLGAQQAQLDIRREETIATSIVEKLIAGPEDPFGQLAGLFPAGTRLISVSGEETTAFVTLSKDFLGKPDGAPTDWEDLTVWQEEAALRRQLAVQSLVLSLTEDGRYQRVQLYIADNDDEVPSRVPLAYFSTSVDDPGVVLAACSRDESYLLTPQRSLDRILEKWQCRDWDAMYAMIAPDDRVFTLEEFTLRMRELDVSLLSYETTTGSVSFDGQRATLVLSAQIRSPLGSDATLSRESVPLYRDMGSWVMTYDTLLSLMVRD